MTLTKDSTFERQKKHSSSSVPFASKRSNYKNFMEMCLAHISLLGHQDDSYLNQQSWRLFTTFVTCQKYLQQVDRVLSFGAGSAFVEAAIKQTTNLEVTVVDFDQAIELNKTYYETLGFHYFARDLSKDDVPLGAELFSLGLSSEIIEHIPEPPANHLNKLGKHIKEGGILMVSTPNLGSFWHILRLIRMLPILMPGDKTFAPVSFENEGIHRREYMPVEIIDAFQEAGFSHVETKFFWYHLPQRFNEWLLFLPQLLVPRLRPGMILVGRKDDNSGH